MSAEAAPFVPTVGVPGRIAAFLRRDLLMAWSYRAAFFADAANLVMQALLFVYVSRLVDVDRITAFGGSQSGYLAFVTVGIAISAFLAIGFGRLGSAIASERFMGTLESVLMTPTGLSTLQLGWLAYDLIYVPIRTGVFIVIMAVAYDLAFDVTGTLPAATFLFAFLPFVWGIGALRAASTMVFRRGGMLTNAGAFALTLGSGAYFPLELLPGWAQYLARFNPLALAVDGSRAALMDSAGWGELLQPLLGLMLLSVLTLVVGLIVFRASLRRELKAGGVGLY